MSKYLVLENNILVNYITTDTPPSDIGQTKYLDASTYSSNQPLGSVFNSDTNEFYPPLLIKRSSFNDLDQDGNITSFSVTGSIYFSNSLISSNNNTFQELENRANVSCSFEGDNIIKAYIDILEDPNIITEGSITLKALPNTIQDINGIYYNVGDSDTNGIELIWSASIA